MLSGVRGCSSPLGLSAHLLPSLSARVEALRLEGEGDQRQEEYAPGAGIKTLAHGCLLSLGLGATQGGAWDVLLALCSGTATSHAQEITGGAGAQTWAFCLQCRHAAC